MNKYASVTVRKSEVKLSDNNIRFRLFNILTEEYVLEYDHYVNGLVRLGVPYQTVSAKAQDLSRFYDYFNTASQVIVDLNDNSSLYSPLVRVFNSFPIFLAFGEDAPDELASRVAKLLNSPCLKPTSIRRILSTVKQFTLESARLEESLHSYASDNLLNVSSTSAFSSELLSRAKMSEHEKKRLLSKSFLAGCISGGASMTSSRLFSVPSIIKKISDSELAPKSFPIKHVIDFCQGLNSLRDKCLYALLFGGGLRMHEALQIKVTDINFSNETVALSCPEAQEFIKNYTSMRHKGVDHYKIFLIEPFKSFFFDAAEAYWKSERPESTSEFFFLTAPRFGARPMFNMSHQSLVDAFRENLKRLNLDHLLHLTPHSTRHFFGFYMLNFCPVANSDGEISYGYPLEKVRYFMRHTSITNTEKYAVPDVEKHKNDIQIANKLLESTPVNLKNVKQQSLSKLMLNLLGE
ncbi:tyrosine-type recombinase/integrase [Alishewanella aestuarii]|uniref:tyrosine-type recombinase/integrase n=1 Tax=Alishewanella aestuarii TaxID=453835 RepID=UPI00145CAF18|nr:site-specific integrase [Alishewanella aestuarii]